MPEQSEQQPNAQGSLDAEQNQSKPLDLEQLFDRLNALDNLVQVAVSNSGARNEARHQLGKLAASIQTLLQRLPSNFEVADVSEKLNEFIANIPPDPLMLSPEKEAELNQPDLETQEESKMQQRLADYIEKIDDGENEVDGDIANLLESERRRVVVACLESGEASMRSTVEVSRSFDSLRWQVTNLGANTPIMALTSIINDVKPAVVVLIMHKANMLVETRRLIADLRKSLYGLKILIAGPIFEEQPSLSSTLGANAYQADLSQIARLAGYLLSPIKNLEEPLQLEEIDLLETDSGEQTRQTELFPPQHSQEAAEIETPKTENNEEIS